MITRKILRLRKEKNGEGNSAAADAPPVLPVPLPSSPPSQPPKDVTLRPGLMDKVAAAPADTAAPAPPAPDYAAADYPTDRAIWEARVPRTAAENPDPVVGWLMVVKGAGRGSAVPVYYGVNTVGRGDDQRARINFGDSCISRRDHVKVTYDDKTRSFFASQGTSVKIAHLNGQPVLQVFPLAAGDRLSLGETELQFVPFCGPAFDWYQA